MCFKCNNFLGCVVKEEVGRFVGIGINNIFENEDMNKCICGTDIIILYPITDTITGLNYIMGSICIKETLSENDARKILEVYCECCDKYVLDIVNHDKTKRHQKKLEDFEKLNEEYIESKIFEFEDNLFC